jgi:hypothetical protein
MSVNKTRAISSAISFLISADIQSSEDVIVKRITPLQEKLEANVQPAFSAGFGVAGAHLSRRSETKEGHPTLNAQ